MWSKRLAVSALALGFALLAARGRAQEAEAPAEAPAERPADPPADPMVAPDAADPLELGELEEPTQLFGSERQHVSFSLSAAGGRDQTREDREELGERRLEVYEARVLLFGRPAARSAFTLAYSPELETTEDQPELETMRHAAGFLYERYTPARSRFFASSSYLEGEDPGRHLGGLLLLSPRRPYREARATAGLERPGRKATMRYRVDASTLRIAPASGFLGEGIDHAEAAASIEAERRFGDRTRLGAGYSLVVPMESWTEEARIGSEPLHTASLGLDWRAGGLELALDGGVIFDLESSESQYLAAAEIRRSGRHVSAGLRYDHSLAWLGSQLRAPGDPAAPVVPTTALRDSVMHAVSADLMLSAFDGLTWRNSLWGARADSPVGEPLEAFAATTRLTVPIAARLALFGEGHYTEQRGPGTNPRRDRTWFALGATLGVLGPREMVRNPDERDRALGVLPLGAGS